MIAIKLNCSKLEKERLFKGKQGSYADLVLMENRDGTDDYGNDGFVVQSVSKAERDAGVRGPIVGNWKRIGERGATPQSRPARPAAPAQPAEPVEGDSPPEGDDVPF